jgi:hypothetical protein
MAVALVALDYLTGPFIQFPVAFFVPVFLAAWYSGPRPALVLALALPAVRAAMVLALWDEQGTPFEILATAALRMTVFVFLAALIARLAEHERAQAREITMLHGILPICMFCKSIRNEADEWEPLERYITHHSTAKFTHGMCPPCRAKHYPEFTPGVAESKNGSVAG